MRLARITYTLTAALLASSLVGGCAKNPGAKETGFLSDYSNLKPVNEKRMNYASGEIRNYQSFIIDPVEFRIPPKQLDKKERGQVAAHFRNRLKEVLQKRQLTVTTEPGPGVARIRIAMTGIADSTWWMKVHPAARVSGAGTGGAAMEGEVVDAQSGKQLGAVVQASPGNQFDFTAFSTVADVNNVIDQWAEQMGQRLDELRAERSAASAR